MAAYGTQVDPVICLTRKTPRPSSVLLDVRIPITLLGRGRFPLHMSPNCLVGLMLRVGLNPPPVSCLKRTSSPAKPVNCRAIVVVPVN